MKAHELINLLQKCKQDAEVEFAYASDATTTGVEIVGVVQIMYLGNSEEEGGFCTVQLRGN